MPSLNRALNLSKPKRNMKSLQLEDELRNWYPLERAVTSSRKVKINPCSISIIQFLLNLPFLGLRKKGKIHAQELADIKLKFAAKIGALVSITRECMETES